MSVQEIPIQPCLKRSPEELRVELFPSDLHGDQEQLLQKLKGQQESYTVALCHFPGPGRRQLALEP